MREDVSLFRYELAIVVIIKNEGRYIKEFIDYHALAGADHFYVYDNESTDNIKEILNPYIESGLVEYIPYPGRCSQVAAYNDAVDKYKFDCRYMAFIDADEFITPRGAEAKSIKDILHDILDDIPFAAGLTPNWYMYSSGGQEKADFTRGVTERFLYRQSQVHPHVKTIANPRLVKDILNCHWCQYLDGKAAINEKGGIVPSHSNNCDAIDVIGINHYFYKSKEEFIIKMERGYPDHGRPHPLKEIEDDMNDKTVVFDDAIVRYQQARREKIDGGGRLRPMISTNDCRKH